MKILVWGGRSKSRIAIAMVRELYDGDAQVSAIFDTTLASLPFPSDIPLFTKKSDLGGLLEACSHFIVCIGGEHGYARYMISKRLEDAGLEPVSLVSRYGILDQLEFCGAGIQVMPGAVAHKFSSIGQQCILNTNSTVDHECRLGNGVHVMGGAAIAGRVSIGDYSTVGTNATIIPGMVIGQNVFIGAGAVVTKDIESGTVVAGVPARRIRQFTPTLDLSPFE